MLHHYLAQYATKASLDLDLYSFGTAPEGAYPDAAFLLAVRNGVRPHHWRFGPMPPIDGITDDDVDDIVAYVRGLQRDAGIIGGGS